MHARPERVGAEPGMEWSCVLFSLLDWLPSATWELITAVVLRRNRTRRRNGVVRSNFWGRKKYTRRKGNLDFPQGSILPRWALHVNSLPLSRPRTSIFPSSEMSTLWLLLGPEMTELIYTLATPLNLELLREF